MSKPKSVIIQSGGKEIQKLAVYFDVPFAKLEKSSKETDISRTGNTWSVADVPITASRISIPVQAVNTVTPIWFGITVTISNVVGSTHHQMDTSSGLPSTLR